MGRASTSSAALLLYVLDKSRRIVGRTRLQKLVFLLLVEGLKDPKDYRLHHYGPYSDQVKMDSLVLSAKGYITHKDIPSQKQTSGFYTIYEITDKGSEWIRANLHSCFGTKLSQIERLASTYLAMKTDQLIEYVYSTYVICREGEADAIREALRAFRDLWMDRENVEPIGLLGAADLEYAVKAAAKSPGLKDDVHRKIVLGACQEVLFAAIECMKECSADSPGNTIAQVCEAYEGIQRIASKYNLLPNLLEDDDPDLGEFVSEEEFQRLKKALLDPLEL